MRIPWMVVLIGCGAGPAPEAPPAAWDGPVTGTAAPPGDVVLTVERGILGDGLPVTITDAYPYEEVELILSTRGVGGGPCPAVIGGACLGVLAPVVRLTTLHADIDGTVTTVLPVPADGDREGLEVCLQAVSVRGAHGEFSDLSEPACTTLERDRDRDGLVDPDELELGTDPLNPDTDGDGLLDGADCAPLDPEVGEFCGDAVCGPLLHTDPEQVVDGWTLCYVAGYDPEDVRDMECHELVAHLDGPIYGCWHGHSEFPHGNDNGMIDNGCRDGVQHDTRYSSWGGDDHILTVCIQD